MSLSDDEDDFLSADEDALEEENNSPNQKSSSFPPAPPPTPALSSSPTSSSVSNAFPDSTEGSNRAEPRSTHQKQVPNSKQISSKTEDCSSPSSADQSKTQQARFALDKLSEKLSNQERSLFEMVAEDIKKVAIRAGETLAPVNNEEPGTSSGTATSDENLPSLVDLGSTIGSWGWSNASKLLNSASKVTSQVTSQVSSQVNAILSPAEIKKDNK